MRTARRASGSSAAHFLARTGLTARGFIYILVGWVAVLVALALLIHTGRAGAVRLTQKSAPELGQ